MSVEDLILQHEFCSTLAAAMNYRVRGKALTECSVIVSGEDEDGTPVYWETVVGGIVAASHLIHAANTDRLCVSMYSTQKMILLYSRPGETEFHTMDDVDR